MGRSLLNVLVVIVATLLLVGCNVRLPGLNDVELEYEEKTPEKRPIPLELQVDLRLLRQRIPATVATSYGHPNSVQITVDEAYADLAEHALAWRGGLTIYRFDPKHALPHEAATAKGDNTLRIAETTEDETHRLLYDSAAALGTDALLPVVHKKPLFDFGGEKVRSEGKTLVISIKDAAPVEALSKELGDEIVAFTRGVYVLHLGRLRDCFTSSHASTGRPALVVPRGTDLYGYYRARNDARVFGPPPLTARIEKVARRPLARDVKLAIGCVVFPLVAGFLWLVFVRRFDRARPEPWWLMLATCVLGGLSGELAGFVEHQLRMLTPYLDPSVMVLDQSLVTFPVTLLVYSISVGAVEEGSKLLAAWSLAMHRREFDEPVDGMLYAAAAGIGFAVDENIGYFANYRLSGGLVASRSLDCIAAHAMLAAIWGYALGKKLVANKTPNTRTRTRVIPFFVLASLLHGAIDTSIAYQVPHSTIGFIVILMTIFLLLLRRTLRWGSIDEVRDEAPPSTSRALFRMGGGAPLGVAISSMYVTGTLLLYAARVVDADHRRVSLPLLTLTAILLIALGVAAYGVAKAMPLDVAIDDLGVTFAGSLRRWVGIEDVTRANKSTLVLHSKEGDLTIGSAAENTTDKLEAAIRARLKPPEP